MKTADFMYDLPESSIAQTPAEPRDHSRLMVLHRDTDQIEHRHFYDVIDYLSPGDVLVVNDTRVIPARLLGERVPTRRCLRGIPAQAAGPQEVGNPGTPREKAPSRSAGFLWRRKNDRHHRRNHRRRGTHCGF